jgi:hypothetical protein
MDLTHGGRIAVLSSVVSGSVVSFKFVILSDAKNLCNLFRLSAIKKCMDPSVHRKRGPQDDKACTGVSGWERK